MRQGPRGAALVVVGLLLLTAPAMAAELALKRVALSSGGVGYFEYEAQVEGDATLGFDVPLDQVDDVLKSLVVYDSSGSAGNVTLPGREPLAQSLVDLPFDRAAFNSAADLLNAVQGAEIRVTGPKPVSGRLVHVDQETVPSSSFPPLREARVSVLTEAGLQQAVLQDAETIAFVDPQLQGQVNAALSRIAAYRGTGRRHLTLEARGTGARQVRVGYVVAVPLWKASYRLSLPADADAATARLQGWAVLVNFSGQPWKDVELTLLSGNPVTFRQALYESYYVPRPNVPVESGGRVLPPADTGTVSGAKTAMAPTVPPPPAPAAPAPASQAARAGGLASLPPAPAAPPPAPIEAANATAEMTQIVFTPNNTVNVAAGQSLMLPLIDRELPARRVDLYQPSVDRRHPMAAVELGNASDTGLPPGVVTLYQQTGARGAVYLGDARLTALAAGDKRLLSFAVDDKVTIDRTAGERRPVVKATIADGVMRITRLNRQTTTYRVKAVGPAPRVIVEQPRRPGAKLTEPDPSGVELTAQAYRLAVNLAGSGEGSLTVVDDEPIEETIRLLDIDDDRLGALAAASELDPKLRQSLSELASRRQALARQRAALDQLNERRNQLVADETRLRDNLSALGREASLRKRLLDSFAATESAIETVTTEIGKTSAAVDTAERDLSSYIAGLNL